MTTAHGDDTSVERPLFREPTDDEIAGLDRDDDLDGDVDDGPDIISAGDDEDDESDEALDREYRRQLAQDLDAIGAWLDDWAGFHAGSIDEALDAYAEALPQYRRERVEEAMTFMDGAVAQLRERVLTLRAFMDEQEGRA
jgi:hypothetical protein